MAVTLYQHHHFGGKTQSFNLGNHDLDEIQQVMGNDQVSSLKVAKGYRARLFEHWHFQGKEVVFDAGDHDLDALRGAGFKNDILSSVIVEKDDECVTLYQHHHFTGNSAKYGAGNHDFNTIASTIGNDCVSSLKVKKGYQAKIYEHQGFGGKEVVFGPGEHDLCSLRECGFQNDILSSLKVE